LSRPGILNHTTEEGDLCNAREAGRYSSRVCSTQQ
jgi:hypothetical protein